VEYKTKFSEQKVHSPGRKQVFRSWREGKYHRDLIALAGESYPDGVELLRPLMRKGHRLAPGRPLAELRSRALENLQQLPEEYKTLRDATPYPVTKSALLERLLDQVRDRYASVPQNIK
jgi:nicotinate phosphoribosyltransferase